jgi:hypothetical protein
MPAPFDNAWVAEIGVAFDILGAIMLSLGLIVSKKRAVELGVSRFSGSPRRISYSFPK